MNSYHHFEKITDVSIWFDAQKLPLDTLRKVKQQIIQLKHSRCKLPFQVNKKTVIYTHSDFNELLNVIYDAEYKSRQLKLF